MIKKLKLIVYQYTIFYLYGLNYNNYQVNKLFEHILFYLKKE
jgi:hypothetical protein